MAKRKDDEDARRGCENCGHFEGTISCDVVGVITPDTRHICYKSGYADWKEPKRSSQGKVPSYLPAE